MVHALRRHPAGGRPLVGVPEPEQLVGPRHVAAGPPCPAVAGRAHVLGILDGPLHDHGAGARRGRVLVRGTVGHRVVLLGGTGSRGRHQATGGRVQQLLVEQTTAAAVAVTVALGVFEHHRVLQIVVEFGHAAAVGRGRGPAAAAAAAVVLAVIEFARVGGLRVVRGRGPRLFLRGGVLTEQLNPKRFRAVDRRGYGAATVAGRRGRAGRAQRQHDREQQPTTAGAERSVVHRKTRAIIIL